jgi:hypothetical protein
MITYGRVFADMLDQWRRRTQRVERNVRQHQLLEQVDEARAEWLLAMRYFDSVTDPELCEHAAYLVKAAERRYVFLLREAKKSRVSMNRETS